MAVNFIRVYGCWCIYVIVFPNHINIMKVKDYHHMKDFKEFKCSPCSQLWKIQPKKRALGVLLWLSSGVKQRSSWTAEELMIFIWGVDDFSSEELTIILIGWGPRTFMGWNLIGSTLQDQFQCKMWLVGVLGPLWGEIWLAERPHVTNVTP